jgi:hypothetical protein
MAVFRCSLKDGRFKVEEVVAFERGDTIKLDGPLDLEATKFSYGAFMIVPCPPEMDCGGDAGIVLGTLPLSAIVVLPPDLRK